MTEVKFDAKDVSLLTCVQSEKTISSSLEPGNVAVEAFPIRERLRAHLMQKLWSQKSDKLGQTD
jgi:hypothetical protein